MTRWDKIMHVSQAFTQAARAEGAPIGWSPPRRAAEPAPPETKPASPEVVTQRPAPTVNEAPPATSAAPTPAGPPVMSLRPPEPPPSLRRPARQEQPDDAPPPTPHQPAEQLASVTGSPVPQSSLAIKASLPITLPPLSLAPKQDAMALGSHSPLTVGKDHELSDPKMESGMSLALTKSPLTLHERSFDTDPGKAIRDILADFGKDLLAAFGTAMTCAHDRRASETLEMFLTGQHEQTALILQGMAQQREYYATTLERAILRLTQDVAPESFVNIGEVFQRSAAEISSALRCREHMEIRTLETLREINACMAKLLTRVNEVSVGSKSPLEVRAEKPAETPNLRVLQTGTGERKRAGILERLGDNDDDSEVT